MPPTARTCAEDLRAAPVSFYRRENMAVPSLGHFNRPPIGRRLTSVRRIDSQMLRTVTVAVERQESVFFGKLAVISQRT